jgi:hypothetical protein
VTHEYPPNRTLDSVSVSRVSALRDYGLTLRQRQFLVTVMVHSECFLERQYCEFTGTVRGQNSREFVAKLVARGFVRAIEPGHVRRGRLYHVHHKPLYEAIGQADNRNRRLHTIGRMVERVMILDAVLGDRRCWWLSPECDKRAFFDLTQQTGLRPEDYPHILFGAGRAKRIRCFPDKLPIGIRKSSMATPCACTTLRECPARQTRRRSVPPLSGFRSAQKRNPGRERPRLRPAERYRRDVQRAATSRDCQASAGLA